MCWAWELSPGAHQIEVIADPEERVIEAARGRENNRLQLKLVVHTAHCTNKKMGPSGPQAINCYVLIRQQQPFWDQEPPWRTSRRSS